MKKVILIFIPFICLLVFLVPKLSVQSGQETLAVPSSGTLEKNIYFNKDLSIDEVMKYFELFDITETNSYFVVKSTTGHRIALLYGPTMVSGRFQYTYYININTVDVWNAIDGWTSKGSDILNNSNYFNSIGLTLSSSTGTRNDEIKDFISYGEPVPIYKEVSQLSFKSMLEKISNLDFKVPNFLELQNVLNDIKELINFADIPWYQYPLRVISILSQLGALLGATVRFIVLFVYDFVYNVIQVLGMFGRLIFN